MGTSGAPTTIRSARGRSAKVFSEAREAAANDDDRLVAGEEGRSDDQPRGRERVHVALVGRGEDVGDGAVLDLRAQLLAAGRVGDDVRAGVILFEPRGQRGERLLQRRGLEDHQLARRRLGRDGHAEPEGC